MKSAVYTNLQRKIIVITLFVALVPLLTLGLTIYWQFQRMYEDKIEEQLRYRAASQSEAVDLFLKERTAILAAMGDTHTFDQMVDERYLAQIFEVINARAGAFVDLGVINNAGRHLAYVGPYDLMGLNYYQQPWFADVMNKGLYISNVYMGFRQSPHFIIAIRRQEGLNTWILRATIDPEIFGEIVRSAQVGKSGDAYILDRDGVFQTSPRFGGTILGKSGLDTKLFGRETTILEGKDNRGEDIFYAGKWLKGGKWLLVVSQGAKEEMSGLFAARNVEIGILLCTLLAIVATVFFTTRLTISQLKQSDLKLQQLNAQLVQSDKLAALGKMAAGVAHEINNPLAVILQKTGWMEDLLEEEAFKKSENYEEYLVSLKKIEEHVERARKVVHGMLGYARKMEPRLEDVDINRTLEETIAFLESPARNNSIRIATDFFAELPIVAGDQSLLQQVFLNLLTNAIDAIGKDGVIEVKTRAEGEYIAISIRDDGPGISKEEQKKVFDPFYTTKEPGKGTGLGLWVSYDIMKKMGGEICIESERGTGTTFTVYLPLMIPEKK